MNQNLKIYIEVDFKLILFKKRFCVIINFKYIINSLLGAGDALPHHEEDHGRGGGGRGEVHEGKLRKIERNGHVL